MFQNVSPTRLRLTGAILCLAGGGLYLGVMEFVEGHWISFFMTGTLGWLTAAGYVAFGLIGIGAFLLIASFVPRRG